MAIIPTFENLRYELKDHIATITIARPKVLNALNGATLTELATAFTAARNDNEVLAIILTGEGEKAFVAGADITEFSGVSAADAVEFARRGQRTFSLVENLGKPVICLLYTSEGSTQGEGVAVRSPRSATGK